MKFDQLLYFVETARFEHVGKAAKALAISPSAVSHAVSKLEEELGRSLFQKKGKRIFLTPHGKALAGKAKTILLQLDSLKANFASDDAELRGHYRFAASHMLAAGLFSPAWAALTVKNPLVSCEIYSLRSAQVIAGVATGEVDVGLCFSPQEHPEIEAKVVRKGQLCIAFRKGHPLIKKKTLPWINRLAEYPSTMPKAFHGVDVCEKHPVLQKHNLPTKAAFVYDSYEAATRFVAESDAWGFFPDWVIEEAGLAMPTHPRDWQAPYAITLLLPRNRPVPKLVSEFAALLLAKGSC